MTTTIQKMADQMAAAFAAQGGEPDWTAVARAGLLAVRSPVGRVGQTLAHDNMGDAWAGVVDAIVGEGSTTG